jgi:hypothetical protein
MLTLIDDQEAWDTYIQNANNMDPSSLQYYPTGDQAQLNPDETPTAGQGQAQGNEPSGFGNSVFMGANTPR